MTEVKVATLNLFNRMGDWEKRAPLVIEQLEALSPDVIAFQEVDLMLDQGMWIARQLNLRLKDQSHYRIKHAASPGKRVSYHGVGTLSACSSRCRLETSGFRCSWARSTKPRSRSRKPGDESAKRLTDSV